MVLKAVSRKPVNAKPWRELKQAMELNTAASVIKYVSRLEVESAALYEEWSKLHENLRNSFERFSEQNKKHEQKVKRAYYSVVSDALETGFCFTGLRSDLTIPKIRQEATVLEILETAIGLEKAVRDFYVEAADLSKCLLADVPREMQKVAKARNERIDQLLAMARSENGFLS